jgi:coenzyme Q-binding protein COQ10
MKVVLRRRRAGMASREPTRRVARGFARWVAAPRHGLCAAGTRGNPTVFPKPLAPGHVLPMDHGPAKPRRRRFFSVPDLDSMRERVFSSTKLVKHAPDVLFNVVKDVARYDEFVPFCASSRVVRAVSPTRFEAELEVGFKVFSETYVSDVTLAEDDLSGKKSVTATAIPPVSNDGLFTRLISTWRFEPTGHSNETKVQFEIDFKVNSVMHAQVVGLVFEEVSRLQIGAFESRCDALFGRGIDKKAVGTDDSGKKVSEGTSEGDEKIHPTFQKVVSAFDKCAANPVPRRGEDDDLDNKHPGLGLRDFSNACRELEGTHPFGGNVANRPFLCGALHAALDVHETGRVSADAAARAATSIEDTLSTLSTDVTETPHQTVPSPTKDTVRELFLTQLRQLKRRMPNVVRLVSSQQQRVLDGEDLSGEDGGKDFDILIETAMADVVVEHTENDVERLVLEFMGYVGNETGGEGESKGFSFVPEKRKLDPQFLSSKNLRGILNIGVVLRLGKR